MTYTKNKGKIDNCNRDMQKSNRKCMALACAVSCMLFFSNASYAKTTNVATFSELKNAINSAVAGDIINFTADITDASEVLNITNSLTINGNGYIYKGTQNGNLFNVGGENNPYLTLNNVTIKDQYVTDQQYPSAIYYGGSPAGYVGGVNNSYFLNNSSEITSGSSNIYGNVLYVSTASDGKIENSVFVDNSINASSGKAFGAAIYETGSASNSIVDSTFIRNSITSDGSNAYGGAIFLASGSSVDKVTGTFVKNSANATVVASPTSSTTQYVRGAVIENGKTVNEISGDFVGNSTTINNSSSTGMIRAYSAAINNSTGNIKNISGNFVANIIQNENNYVMGSVMYNGAVVGDINADFVENVASGKYAYGVIYNSNGTRSIGDITGDFINNSSQAASAAYGAITNNISDSTTSYVLTIGDVTGDYVKNTITNSGTSISVGSAIFNRNNASNTNTSNSEASFGKVQGNFVANSTKATNTSAAVTTGAIANIRTCQDAVNKAFNITRIRGIAGRFVKNTISTKNGKGYGAAIYNTGEISVEDGSSAISADFVGNSITSSTTTEENSSLGAAIYNTGEIGGVQGNFVQNSITNDYYGVLGATIFNKGEIGNIIADFVGNTATASAYASGSAIYTKDAADITSIKGDFVSNKSTATGSADDVISAGGAIAAYNTKITELSGNFVNNSIVSNTLAYGGAISYDGYNTDGKTLKIVDSSFINNKAQGGSDASSLGGAIYYVENQLSGTNFDPYLYFNTNDKNIVFHNNYAGTVKNDIYVSATSSGFTLRGSEGKSLILDGAFSGPFVNVDAYGTKSEGSLITLKFLNKMPSDFGMLLNEHLDIANGVTESSSIYATFRSGAYVTMDWGDKISSTDTSAVANIGAIHLTAANVSAIDGGTNSFENAHGIKDGVSTTAYTNDAKYSMVSSHTDPTQNDGTITATKGDLAENESGLSSAVKDLGSNVVRAFNAISRYTEKYNLNETISNILYIFGNNNVIDGNNKKGFTVGKSANFTVSNAVLKDFANSNSNGAIELNAGNLNMYDSSLIADDVAIYVNSADDYVSSVLVTSWNGKPINILSNNSTDSILFANNGGNVTFANDYVIATNSIKGSEASGRNNAEVDNIGNGYLFVDGSLENLDFTTDGGTVATKSINNSNIKINDGKISAGKFTNGTDGIQNSDVTNNAGFLSTSNLQNSEVVNNAGKITIGVNGSELTTFTDNKIIDNAGNIGIYGNVQGSVTGKSLLQEQAGNLLVLGDITETEINNLAGKLDIKGNVSNSTLKTKAGVTYVGGNISNSAIENSSELTLVNGNITNSTLKNNSGRTIVKGSASLSSALLNSSILDVFNNANITDLKINDSNANFFGTLQGTTLTLNDGHLNLANGTAQTATFNTLNSNAGYISLDWGDKLSATNYGLQNSDLKFVNLIDNVSSGATTSNVYGLKSDTNAYTYTNTGLYTVTTNGNGTLTATKDTTNSGLRYAIASATQPIRSYSMVADETLTSGALSFSSATTDFALFGNGHTLTGANNTVISLSKNAIIDNVTFKGFSKSYTSAAVMTIGAVNVPYIIADFEDNTSCSAPVMTLGKSTVDLLKGTIKNNTANNSSYSDADTYGAITAYSTAKLKTVIADFINNAVNVSVADYANQIVSAALVLNGNEVNQYIGALNEGFKQNTITISGSGFSGVAFGAGAKTSGTRVINANFEGNTINITGESATVDGKALGGALHVGNVGYITGNFIDNAINITKESSKAYAVGGAIYNNSSVGNIIGNFTGNSITNAGATGEGGNKDSFAYGGAIGAFVKSDEVRELSFGNIIGDFTNNSVTTGRGYAGGGAIAIRAQNSTLDKAHLGDVIGNFTGNKTLATAEYYVTSPSTLGSYANGGAINLSNVDAGNIIGNFESNIAEAHGIQGQGGAIYINASSVENIIGNFTSNEAITNNTTDGGNVAQGGAIWNYNSTIGLIKGKFKSNITSSTGSTAAGGAIFNYTNSSTDPHSVIGAIIGDFENNMATSSSGTAFGGAICGFANTHIGNITGSFIENSSISNSSTSAGGAISSTNAVIGNIIGDFKSNYANSTVTYAYGGAIYNVNNKIGDITGDFESNHVDAPKISLAGTIYNSNGTIGDITGNFVSNYAKTSSGTNALGGAIYNLSSSKIGDITGNFKSNYVESQKIAVGGAVDNNKSTIGNITGNFESNYSKSLNSSDGYSYGGGLYNSGTIGNITGDFIDNHTIAVSLALGGAIYNKGTIGDITGLFRDNEVTSDASLVFGGAIYNENAGKIQNITGSFLDNLVESNASAGGGAIVGRITADDINSNIIASITGTNVDDGDGGTGLLYAFKNNRAVSTSTDSSIYARGGAISISVDSGVNNSSISMGDITGSFIGNKALAVDDDSTTTILASTYGGAIYNAGNSSIGNIIGSFVGNAAKSEGGNALGGAIFNNSENSIIGNITGSFIDNQATAESGYTRGGAIYNIKATIGDIEGDFTNNFVKSSGNAGQGGAIFNNNEGTIGAIKGNFTNNSVESNGGVGHGGAIFNSKATIGNITGNFDNNKADSSLGTAKAQGGAILNGGAGSIGKIVGSFTGNQIKATDYLVHGGAIVNGSGASIGDITGSFLNNSAEIKNGNATGGAISNRNFDSPSTVYNTVFGKITGTKYDNDEGGTGLLYAFKGNVAKTTSTTLGSYVYGGAIANFNENAATGSTATIGDITGSFIGNKALAIDDDTTTTVLANAYGGAIYNGTNSTIGNITGSFINNQAKSEGGNAFGGAIYNAGNSSIGNIIGSFVGNEAKSEGGKVLGGAIYNYNYATIGNITGNFNSNYAKSTETYAYGGAIYNYNYATIGDIKGSFTGNEVTANTTAFGGAIYNNAGIIGNITGNFNSNYATTETYAFGGAIYNENAGKIQNITGSFLDNLVESEISSAGGAIAGRIIADNTNSNIIASITGTNVDDGDGGTGLIYAFKNNRAVSTSTKSSRYARGGAISISVDSSVNNSSISMGDITGSFIGNKALAIDDDATTTVLANAYGGAIYNGTNSTIGNITGSFINNEAKSEGGNAFGGAIYNDGTISILANNDDVTFSGNYVLSSDSSNMLGGAIYNDVNGVIALNANDGKSITFVAPTSDLVAGAQYDTILNNGTLNINANEVNTGSVILHTAIKGSTGAGIVNIKHGSLNLLGDAIIEKNTINIDRGAKLSIGTGATVDPESSSAINWNGIIENTGGTLVLNGNVTRADDDYSNFIMTAGNTTINADEIVIKTTDTVSGGSFDVKSSKRLVNNTAITATITNAGTLNNALATSSIIGDVTNSGSITNAGTITGAIINNTSSTIANSGTITGTLTNNGTITGIGSLELTGDSTNSSSITQSLISLVADKKLTNDGTIASALTNNGIITGTGSLELTGDSTNDGSITQSLISLVANKKLTNEGTITAALTNAGTIEGTGNIELTGDSTNSNSITQSSISLASNKKLTNNGTIIANVTNNGTLNNALTTSSITGDVTNSGTLTNAGTITGAVTNNASSTITNNKTITGSLTNSGTIDGTGNIELTGDSTNSSSIIQSSISLASSKKLTNNGTITADVTNNGTLNNALVTSSITGAVTNLGTLTNAGTISGAVTNNASSTITNNKTITGSLTNNGTINGTGNIELTGDSTNSSSIIQNTISLASGKKLTNNGIITTDSIANDGTIKLTDNSSLTINAQTSELSGAIDAIGAVLISIDGTNKDISSALTIGDGSTSTVLTLDKGNIKDTATILLKDKSTLKLTSSSSAIMNTADSWLTGSLIDVNGGTLTVADAIKSGELKMTSGTLNVSSDITIDSTDTITGGLVSVSTGKTLTNNLSTFESQLQNSGTITGTGNIKLTDDSTNDGSITQTLLSLVADKKLTNAGTITGALTNNGTIEGTGNIELTGNSTNSSSITQNAISLVADKKLTNSGTITSAVTNNGTIEGTGSLELTGNSTNSGTITQAAVSLASDKTLTFNGNSSLTTTAQVAPLEGTIIALNENNILSIKNADTNKDINATVNIGDGTTLSSMTLNGGNITSSSTVNIKDNSTLNVSGGSVVINTGDTYAGAINLSSGNLVYEDLTSNGGLTATGGVLTIGNGSGSADTVFNLNSGSQISATTKFVLNSDAQLNINSGSIATISGGDETLNNVVWAGDVNLCGGTLSLSYITDASRVTGSDPYNKTGKLIANSGKLSLDGTTVLLGNNDVISDAVNVTINAHMIVDTNSNVSLSSSDNLNNIVEVKGGTLNLNNIETTGLGKIIAENGATGTINVTGTSIFANNDKVASGNLNIGNGVDASSLTITNATIGDAANVDIKTNSTLNLNSGTLTLNTGDSISGALNITGTTANIDAGANWTGVVSLASGTLNLNDAIKSSSNKLNMTGGVLNVNANSVINSTDTVSGGIVNIIANKTLTNNLSTFESQLSNNGTITGTGSLELTGDSTNDGSIAQSSISLASSKKLTNNGTITANVTNNGTLNNALVTSSITGDVTNSGSITNAGTITGSLTNNGTIEGTGNVELTGDSTNSNSITQSSISLASNKKLTNNGTITANVTNNGTLNNALVTSSITGDVTNSGTITNAGTISGALTNNASSTITNNKTITGSLTNSGTIDGTGNIELTGDSTNSNSITQSSISLASSKKLTNNGTITADVTNNGTLNNALVTSSITGAVANSGTLTNAGTISGAVTNNASSTITNNKTITGSLTNSGTIDGTGNIELTGDSTNSSSIIQNTISLASGKKLTNNGTITTDSIANDGTIKLTDNSSLTINAQTTELLGAIEAIGSALISVDGTNKDISSALTVGDGSTSTVLTIDKGNIKDTAIVSLKDKSTLKLTSNSSAIINSADSWVTGSLIDVNGGTLTVADAIKSGELKMTSGKLNVSSDITIGSTDTITGGLVSVSTGKTLTNNLSTFESQLQNSGTITGTGNIELTGDSTNDGSITQSAISLTSGTLTNNGTITADVTNNGTLNNALATSSIIGDVTNSGSIANAGTITGDVTNNASSTITNAGTITGALTNNGTIEGTGNIELTGASTNLGSITQGALSLASGTLTNSGTITAAINNNGTITNDLNKSITLTGNSTNTNSIQGQGTLNLANGVNLDNSGSIADSIILNISSGSVLSNSATLTVSSEDIISGQINLTSGTLKLKDNVSIADLNLSAGAGNSLIDMSDSTTSTYNIAKVQGQGSDIKIDVNLNTGSSDKFIIATAEGTPELRLTGINILQDGYANLITYIEGATSAIKPTIYDVLNPSHVYPDPSADTSIVMTSGGYIYTFVSNNNGSLSVSSRFDGTLAEAIATNRVLSYSLTSDLVSTTSLGTLATKEGGRTFTLYGNNYTLSSSYTGITIANADDIFNSENIKINGFTNSFITLNAGTVNLDNVTVENQTITSDGVLASVNGGTLNIKSSSLSDNKAQDGGIFKVAAGGVLNSTDTSYSSNTATAKGGAIENAGTANIIADSSDVVFSGNKATISGGAIENTGTLNLVANQGKKIEFKTSTDTIHNTGVININPNSTSGDVKLNSELSGTGSVNISNGSLIVTSDGVIADEVALNIQSKLENQGGTLNVGTSDTWNGEVIQSSGTLNLNAVLKTASNKLIMTGGTLNVSADSVISSLDTISSGLVKVLAGATLTNQGTINPISINNLGDIVNDSNIITSVLTNSGTITGTGNLELTGDSTNSGSITQNSLKIASGKLTSSNVINANIENLSEIDNKFNINGNISNKNVINNTGNINGSLINSKNSEITGTGKITINENSSNEGFIAQSEVIVSSGKTFDNAGTLSSKVTNNSILNNTNLVTGEIVNNGDINNSKTIETSSLTNNSNIFLEEGSSLTINGDSTNSGIIDGIGTLNIASGKQLITSGSIGTSIVKNITGTLKISDGILSLSSKDSWNGTINETGGTLDLADVSSGGTLEISDGILNLNNNQGNTLTLSTIDATGGKLCIDWGDSINATTVSNNNLTLSAINFAQAPVEGETYNLSGIKADSSISAFVDDKKYTILVQDNKVKVDSTVVDNVGLADAVQDSTSVKTYATTNDYTETKDVGSMSGTDMTISGNGYSINGGEKLAILVGETSSQTLNIVDAKIQNFKTTTEIPGSITLDNGSTLNIVANESDVLLGKNSDSSSTNNSLYMRSSSGNDTINIQANSGKNVVIEKDIISSNSGNKLNLSGDGVIYLNGLLDPLEAVNSTTVVRNGNDEDITWNLNSGMLIYNNDSYLNYVNALSERNNINFNGGALSLINNVATNIVLDTININGNSNLYLDMDVSTQKMDTLSATVGNKTGTLNVSGLNIFGTPTSNNVEIDFISPDLGNEDLWGHVTNSVSKVETPIYLYDVSYEETQDALMKFGKYKLGVTKNPNGNSVYNPAILASPVVAQMSGYATMLENFNEGFRFVDNYMNMPKLDRMAYRDRNKYALLDNTPQYTGSATKSAWVSPYTSFENVKLDNGPDVDAISYGTYFGVDSDIYTLKHGWDVVYSMYAGYNGAYQTYSGVNMNYNGGSLGAAATFLKGNFFTAIDVAIGGGISTANTMYGTEYSTLLNVGAAVKSGYNFEFKNGRHIIQPSLMLGYSMINTFDYTNAAGVDITSDPLHAIIIQPQLKYIMNLKNGWQPYAAVSMVFNIMDKAKFYAQDIALPEMSMKPYVQYGLGVQKKWGERCTGYVQAMVRNGGRNGVALSLGFKWQLGKDSSNSNLKEINNKKQKL